MKKILPPLCLAALFSVNAQAQCPDCHNGRYFKSATQHAVKRTHHANSILPYDTLTQNYLQQNICGLNFTQVSILTETRTKNDSTNVNGVGLPATLNLTGLPIISCPTILKAYIYFGCSYQEANPPAASITLTNPAHTLSTVPSVLTGTGDPVCWGETGTAMYRTDVTSLIAGNGNYTMDVNGFTQPEWEVDGLTLLVVYADPSAAYSGNISLCDGDLATDIGNQISSTNIVSVCSATSMATAFALLGDIQDSTGTSSFSNNFEIYNGVTDTFPNLFWNYCAIPVNLHSGLDTVEYTSIHSRDCYFMGMTGLYWQNTTCVSCTPLVSTLTLTPSSIAVTCGDNGSASVIVSGGRGPLTYFWSPGGQTTDTAIMVLPGTYTVNVSDGYGCTGDTITVSNAGMALTTSSTPQHCIVPGSATINVTGGTPPYTYLWSNNATSTSITAPAGWYSVSVSDSAGCTLTDTISIFYSSPLTGYCYSQQPVACPPSLGWLTAYPYGGASPYTYSWSPGGATTATISGLTGGNYTVMVTDSAGCLLVMKDSVYSISNLLSLFCYSYPYYCPLVTGSAIALPSNGIQPYTYLWSPGGQTTDSIGGLSAGTYTATVTDANGCNITSSVSVSLNPVTHSINCNINSIWAGDTDWVSAQCNIPATYHWSPPAFVLYPDSLNAELFPDTTTTFTLTTTTPCGVYTDTVTIFVTGCANLFNESICIVTIDTNTNRDEIIWERFNSPPDGSYLIYKENSSSTYSFLVSQSVFVTSDYIDTASRPNLGPCSYKLGTEDSCGLSAISLPHTSVFLTDTTEYHLNVLNWTPYFGFTPSKYLIYRGLTLHTLVAIDSVLSTVFTYHDTNPPASAIYMVQAVNPSGPCVPTAHILGHNTINGNTLVSRSNVRKLKNITGIPDLYSSESYFNLYPNPGNGIFMLESTYANGNCSIEINNVLGETIINKRIVAGKEEYNLSSQPNGMYFYRVKTEKGDIISIGKIVIVK